MNILFSVIIYPLTQIIKISYVMIYKIFENHGISVIGVGFAVTILCLPLYIIAEKWQQIERQTVKSLKPKIGKIKAVFKGDEQYMVLSTYYRQNHYHPIFALRSSFGILIQVPFFLAAYSYLSKLQALKGVSFLFVRDLGSPDSCIGIGGFTVNILPILMTLINCAAGAVYTSDLSSRDRIQVYGLALVFLVVLYNSPAGLVLYWTVNNILSLVKNIFYRLKDPLKTLYIITFIFSLVFLCYILFIHNGSWKKKLFFALLSLTAVGCPCLVRLIRYFSNTFLPSFAEDNKRRYALFFLSCLSISLLSGVVIPSTVIASSPEEFSFIDAYKSPLPFVFSALFQSLGVFLFWPGCVFFLYKNRVQAILGFLFFFMSAAALVNVFFFSGNYGLISNTFLFETPGVLNMPAGEILFNLLIVFLLAVISLFVLKLIKKTFITAFLVLAILSLTGLSAKNIAAIQTGYLRLAAIRDPYEAHTISPVLSLSRDKPNLIVIMADGAVNGFFEPILEEHPGLKQKFDGFVLYPGTVSFSTHTLMAVPAIWGGYDYTPVEMNRNADKPLAQKHNEALLVLPTLLAEKAYSVTVTDPSWANYSLIADTTIYKNRDNIKAYNLMGKYRNLWIARNDFKEEASQSRQIIENIVWFSFLKISPLVMRLELYDDGKYWSGESYSPVTVFLNSYSELDFLPELTDYNSSSSSALFITNDATHDSIFLRYPDYVPAGNVTDVGSGKYSKMTQYHSNNAFYLKMGRWFDDLKENKVYDNTRILIVSDHGVGVNVELPGDAEPFPGVSLASYNPVLLFKDFNSHGEPLKDMSFMTNADVPALALKGIVGDPVNPFTGNKISMEPKKAGVFITTNHLPMAHHHGGNRFTIENDQWLYVHDNIFDKKNWAEKDPFQNQ
jgi:YidC/Oxa1 family membrane protein insertase